MELKSGYKQTEVGVIPEEWETKSLGEISIVTAGGTPSRSIPEYWNGEIPWVTTTEIDFCTISDTAQTISEAGLEYSAAKLLKPGTLLLALYGQGKTRGKIAILGIRAATNQACASITLCSAVSRIYAYHYLSSRYDAIRGLSNSGSQENLNSAIVKSLLVALPPTKAAQEAIAKALSDADALIESLEQLIAKKRHLKRGAMQELLRPRDGWVAKRLGNTAVLKARIGWQGLTTDEYRDSGDYYLVTGTDFKGGYIDWSHCQYVDKSRYTQDSNIQLRDRDVLVTKDGTIGKVAFVGDIGKPATLNSGVFVIRPVGDSFDPEFFYHLLCSNMFTDFLGQLSAGSTINHLYQKDFVNFMYRTPAVLAEQTTIASILRDMDARSPRWRQSCPKPAKLSKA
jgi:type I restriction enzyme, S subunit